MSIEIRIDPEFESLCPPLTPEERNLLETSIDAEGCRDALVTWRGLLVDGHNRLSYCRSAKMPFKATELDVGSREEVIEWIVKNQLGRRNLSEEQKSYLRGKRYASEKKTIGKPANRDTVSPLQTADKLASEYGVSGKTIKRDAEFATAVDTLAANVGPEIKSQILSGDSPLTKKQVVAIAELPPKQQAQAAIETARGKIKDLREKIADKPKTEKATALEWDTENCFSAMRTEAWRWFNATPKPECSQIVEILKDIVEEFERKSA